MHDLNNVLSDLYVLNTKTKNFHWNVKGPRFIMLHEFFQKHYEAMDDFVDELAEQMKILGQSPVGTLSNFLKSSHIKESDKVLSEDDMLKELLADHKHMVLALKEVIKKYDSEPGAEDMLIELLRFHEKTVWMIESHL
ncbi:MAG: Dps family protein [Candidatus Woesearchaeota archaeon]